METVKSPYGRDLVPTRVSLRFVHALYTYEALATNAGTPMKRAFTLIELLVVIAIIAILAAILFPVFAQAKQAAKRTAELSNFKQISLSAILYSGDSDDVFPTTS